MEIKLVNKCHKGRVERVLPLGDVSDLIREAQYLRTASCGEETVKLMAVLSNSVGINWPDARSSTGADIFDFVVVDSEKHHVSITAQLPDGLHLLGFDFSDEDALLQLIHCVSELESEKTIAKSYVVITDVSITTDEKEMYLDIWMGWATRPDNPVEVTIPFQVELGRLGSE